MKQGIHVNNIVRYINKSGAINEYHKRRSPSHVKLLKFKLFAIFFVFGIVASLWEKAIFYHLQRMGGKALERAKTSEPFGYLLQPFRESALHSTIEIALYKHSAEQKLKILNETLELRVEERTRELSDRSLLAELGAEVGIAVIQMKR